MRSLVQPGFSEFSWRRIRDLRWRSFLRMHVVIKRSSNPLKITQKVEENSGMEMGDKRIPASFQPIICNQCPIWFKNMMQ